MMATFNVYIRKERKKEKEIENKQEIIELASASADLSLKRAHIRTPERFFGGDKVLFISLAVQRPPTCGRPSLFLQIGTYRQLNPGWFISTTTVRKTQKRRSTCYKKSCHLPTTGHWYLSVLCMQLVPKRSLIHSFTLLGFQQHMRAQSLTKRVSSMGTTQSTTLSTTKQWQ